MFFGSNNLTGPESSGFKLFKNMLTAYSSHIVTLNSFSSNLSQNSSNDPTCTVEAKSPVASLY
ncbi:hypothetical protein HanHA300_Chr09g0319671 [Helianthus annuus]|nr:hypothetical protein HanHA300_Chr09g0319671 [Helianthus annuus]KAJ0707553.1 hypothetical protein HanLR1_Chr09g0319801 [Helianthus annuus]